MKHFNKAKKVLNLRRLINLTVQGKIPIFKMLACYCYFESNNIKTK